MGSQITTVGIKRLHDDLGVNTAKLVLLGCHREWKLIKTKQHQTTTNADGTSTTLIPGLVTTEENVQKKNDVKARRKVIDDTFLNEHLMTFAISTRAQTLSCAIQTTFWCNEATKSLQKGLLLKTNEDINLKFLRSLPSKWNTHVVVWRNKPDLDTMSFDDLYNNFKIVKQEVKGTSSSSSSLSSQNIVLCHPLPVLMKLILFMELVLLTLNQPNESQLVYEDLEQIHEDDIEEMDLKWQLALLSMRTRRFFQKTGRKITINGSNTAGYDKSKDCKCGRNFLPIAMVALDWSGFDGSYMADDGIVYKTWHYGFFRLYSSRSTINVEETSSKAMLAIDGASFDWGFMADEEFNSGLEEFQQPKFEGYRLKTSKSVSEDTSNEVEESPDASLVEELLSNDKLEKKTVFPNVAKINFVRPQQQEKLVRKPVKYAEIFNHMQANCNYHQKERMVFGNNYTRVNYNYSAKKAHPSAHRNIVPRAVLMKTGLRPLNTARPVNTAHPKTIVYSARPMSCFSKSAQSTVKRPYSIKTTLTNKNYSQKVNTAKGSFYTARPKAVNTARPNSAVVNAVRANQGHLQKEDQGYVDSGCSRHMTGNMSYLSDFKEFDGGYVAFGGGAKGGRITGKGTLKTGKLDFEDVYFVKEL
ncbi:hypothetical protein Tco_0084128 [Tanacetum coccineum]